MGHDVPVGVCVCSTYLTIRTAERTTDRQTSDRKKGNGSTINCHVCDDIGTRSSRRCCGPKNSRKYYNLEYV